MAIFDYVMLLISVVLSLGLARLLERHARLLKRGAEVKWSATYLAWFAILGAMHVYLWATLWAVHTEPHWPWTVVLGFCFEATFLPAEQFLSAAYTVGLPIVVGCILAMVTANLWAQRTIAIALVAAVAWYFAAYLPGFSA